jgi:hypothetical protein
MSLASGYILSLASGCVMSLASGIVSLVLGYVGYRSVGILVTVEEQVITAGIVAQVLGWKLIVSG